MRLRTVDLVEPCYGQCLQGIACGRMVMPILEHKCIMGAAGIQRHEGIMSVPHLLLAFAPAALRASHCRL